MTDNPHLNTARLAWGEDLPDWVEALAIECGRTSQSAVAKALQRSAAFVNQVLARKYTADTARIEERVRGTFLNAVLICPALGELPLQDCQDWRGKAGHFALGNPMRTRMFRACNRCPRHLKEDSQ